MDTGPAPPVDHELLDAVLAIGSDLDLEAMLHRIVASAVQLVGARYGALGVLDQRGVGLAQFVTVGVDEATHAAIGDLPDGHGILGLLIADPRPLRLADLRSHPESSGFPPHHPPMQSFLGVPITVRGEVFGNLYLTDKVGAAEFSDRDEQLAVGLASAVAVTVDNARLHSRLQALTLIEDRERIARDLHDSVIQRLFATGLALQATARRVVDNDDLARRIDQAVDDLDVTIKHIRSAIFGLSSAPRRPEGLGERVMSVLREATPVLGFEPTVLIDGPLDSAVPDDVAHDLLATLREALTNFARHARASRVDVAITVEEGVSLVVHDDGVGPEASQNVHGRGLHNLADRAARHGGALHVDAGPTGGMVLRWNVPRHP
ncbi:hypothetical protein BH24ACT5_BH24ACT5_22970 [soil metagenome]